MPPSPFALDQWRRITADQRTGSFYFLHLDGITFKGRCIDGVWHTDSDIAVREPTHWMPLPGTPSEVVA